MKSIVQVIDEIVDNNIKLPTPIKLILGSRFMTIFEGEILNITDQAVTISFIRETDGKPEVIKFSAKLTHTTIMGSVDYEAIDAFNKTGGSK